MKRGILSNKTINQEDTIMALINRNKDATNSELDAKQIVTNKEGNKEKSNNERSDYCEGKFIPNFHD